MSDKLPSINFPQPDPGAISEANIQTEISKKLLEKFTEGESLSVWSIADTVIRIGAATLTIGLLKESGQITSRVLDVISKNVEWAKFKTLKKDTIEITLAKDTEDWYYKNNKLDIHKLISNEKFSINNLKDTRVIWSEFTSIHNTLVEISRNNNILTFTFPCDQNTKTIIDNVLIKSKKITKGVTSCYVYNHSTQSSSTNKEGTSMEGRNFPVAMKLPHYSTLQNMLTSYNNTYLVLSQGSNNFIPPKALNFNGPPGTGKSTFCSYASELGIFDMVIWVPMNQAESKLSSYGPTGNSIKSFSKILDSLLDEIKKKKSDKKTNANLYILIMFDEIDKYLKKYVEIQIEIKRIQAATLTVRTQTDPNKNQKSVEETHVFNEDDANREMQTQKNNFLDRMLILLDQGLGTEDNFVFIFGTNEFEYLFQNVDSRHATVRSRIEKFEFTKIGKENIILFIDSFYERIRENATSEQYQNAVKTYFGIRDDCIAEMNCDVILSYRALNNIIVKYTLEPAKIFEEFDKIKLINKKDCIDLIEYLSDIQLPKELADKLSPHFKMPKEECCKIITLYINSLHDVINILNEQFDKFGIYSGT